ncbi:hypothetical protein AgCh_009813 [Apium graveolens]
MVDATVSFAVETLSNFVIQQVNIRIGGVTDSVRWLKDELVYLQPSDLESLKERINVMKNRRVKYGIDNILATSNVQQKNRTILRTIGIDNQVDVIGFEDDIKTLLAELNSEDPSLKVIFIHGIGGGGLGKTSLATKLYNSSELRHFDTCAKVSVSMEYNIKDVLKRIIKFYGT